MCKTKYQVLWSESWAVLEGLWVHALCSFTLETNIATVVQKLSQHVLMGSPVCSHRLNVNVWKEAESNRSASMQSWNLHWTVVPLNFVEVSDGGLEVLCAHLFLFSPCRFFALTSLRLLCLLASGLAVLVFVDTWRNKIWPQIRGATSCFFRLLLSIEQSLTCPDYFSTPPFWRE